MTFIVSNEDPKDLDSDDTNNRLIIRTLARPELSLIEPMLELFYPEVAIDTLRSRIDEISNLNWRCLGVFNEQGKLVALSGFWINTRLYCGKYLYVDHFIVNLQCRSQGIGTRLLECLKTIAHTHKCEQVCLDTFITNSSAQKFWFQQNFSIVGFHFTQSLTSQGSKCLINSQEM